MISFISDSLQHIEQFVTIHLLTIILGLSTNNFKFGKTYNFMFPCKFAKKLFFYKKYLHNYLQLYSQLYLLEVYSEHVQNNSFLYNIFFKGALLGLRQFLAIGSPLKMMKSAFYFTSKALFILKIFKFLS